VSGPSADSEDLDGSPTGLAAAIANLRSVFGSPDLRRIQLAFLGSTLGDWAYSTALLVYAYHEGGATLVGVWGGVRFLLIAVAAPIGGTLADRTSRRSFMLLNDGIRLVLVVVAALCIYRGAPVLVVLGLGIAVGVVGGSFRAAQAGLIPLLAEDSRQLTASNATAEILESIGLFVGPALGGLLLGFFAVEWVVLFNGLTFMWSMALVSGVRRVNTAAAHDERDDERDDGQDARKVSFVREMSEGFTELVKDADMRSFTGLLALNGALNGALTVLLVLIAADSLGSASGVGYLNAVLGGGTVVGGFLMLARAGRVRMGRAMVVGVLGWSLPLMVIGLAPASVLLALSALLVLGVADPLINVGLGTIPQRLVDERLLSRVFGALESVMVVFIALGSFAVPALVHATSLSGALILVGAVGTVLTACCAIRMPHLDARLTAPPGLALIRSLPLFASLTPAVQESLARKLHAVQSAPGDVIVAEGATSDRFFVIEDGRVEVTRGGQPLRQEGPGDVFGEIGLLRDTPRTATVTALTEASLQTLSREDFLEALTYDQDARSVAEDLVARRLPF
jgi:MFS family permease